MKLHIMITILLAFCAATANAEGEGSVILETGDSTLVLNNGLVRLGIDKGGRLIELSYRGGPNLASGDGINSRGRAEGG